MNSNSILTVCIITYNHEDFIVNALESVLHQITDFNFQIVIADDFSTDNTRDILEKYKSIYNDKITLIFQKENVGAAKNWIDLLKYPKTKYTAYLEGDDYWLDNNKLQRQFDFLEKNNEFILCASNSRMLLNSEFIDQPSSVKYNTDTFIKFENLIGDFFYNPIPTSTIMFRTYLIDNVDFNFIIKFGFTDWPLLVEISRFGKIYMFKDYFSVYRVHSNGVWTAKNKIEKKISVLKFYFLIADRYPKFDNLCRFQISNLIDEIKEESNQYVEKFFKNKIDSILTETKQRDYLKKNFSFKDILVVLFKKLIDKLSFFNYKKYKSY